MRVKRKAVAQAPSPWDPVFVSITPCAALASGIAIPTTQTHHAHLRTREAGLLLGSVMPTPAPSRGDGWPMALTWSILVSGESLQSKIKLPA